MIQTSPEKFFWLTSTAWTAISSFVAAASVMILVIFNWRYLRLVHQQSDAAMKQVELTTTSISLTKDSLAALKKQMTDEEERERHTVIAIMTEVYSNLAQWERNANMEFRTNSNPIQLRPDDWNLVVSFASRHDPNKRTEIFRIGHVLRDLEIQLNRYVGLPIETRKGDASLGQTFVQLVERLKSTRDSLAAFSEHLPLQ